MKTMELAKPKGAAQECQEDVRTAAHEAAAMGRDRASPRLEGRPKTVERLI